MATDEQGTLQCLGKGLVTIITPLMPARWELNLLLFHCCPPAGEPLCLSTVAARDGLQGMLRYIEAVADGLLDSGMGQLHGDPPDPGSGGMN